MFAYYQNCQVIRQRNLRRYHRYNSFHHITGTSCLLQSGSQCHIFESTLRQGVNQSIAIHDEGIPRLKSAATFLISLFR